MNYDQAHEKLQQHTQTHLLKYYDTLTPAEQEKLLTQIAEIDFSVLESIENQAIIEQKGVISPLKAMEMGEIDKRRAAFSSLGLEAIRAGKVGAVLLAGGMGTRLGSAHPKGMYDIGLTRPVYIFQRLIENMLDVVKEAGVFIPLYIMVSEKNQEATSAFLADHDYFGYDANKITFFKQDMAPASDYQGKVFLEEKGWVSTSPNGNGGWYASMHKWGIAAAARADGIEWFNIFAVDNVLQRICDPVFVGATIDSGFSAGAKVVRKSARDEKLGTICLEDGRPSIVEYYDMTDELMDAVDENGAPAYNFGVILNYLFKADKLDEIMARKLPLHVVEKKISHLNAAGKLIHPTAPNGYKYEQLVLDMIHEFENCLPYEVLREHEFAPIKNLTGVDSVESARGLCLAAGVEL